MKAGPVAELDTTHVAENALTHYDVGVDRIQLLAESFNTLYRIDSGGARYVLRVGPALQIHEPDAAEGEAAWTDQLAAAGLSVPRAIRTRTGRAAVAIAVTGQSRICTLCTWFDGQTLDRLMSPDDAIELGELSATLHAASTPLSQRPGTVLDGRSALLFRIPVLLDRAEDAELFTTCLSSVQASIDNLWARSPTPRLLHGDLTASNVVRHRDRLVPIDFQDMFWGHPEQDIANTLFSYLRHDDGTLARHFRLGYERRLPWPDLDDHLLADLLAARRLMMVNLALALGLPGVAEYIAVHASGLRAHLPNAPLPPSRNDATLSPPNSEVTPQAEPKFPTKNGPTRANSGDHTNLAHPW